jgi:hypothetical protein
LPPLRQRYVRVKGNDAMDMKIHPLQVPSPPKIGHYVSQTLQGQPATKEIPVTGHKFT